MNYIVMECHEAYAILMDEESRFFQAANLHYSVGQTITEPILMQRTQTEAAANISSDTPRIRRIVMRVAAAAACLLIAAGAGYSHFMKNYHTDAVVILNSDANIRMYLNKDGKVVKLKSDNDAGAALLESYDGRRKNKVIVAHELLALQKASGSINDGDTVEVYISAQTTDEFDEYKTEFESDISKLKLNVNVQNLTEHPEITATTEPPVDTEKPEKKEPLKPDPKKEKEPPVKPDKKAEDPLKNETGKTPATGVQPQTPADPQIAPVKPPVPPEPAEPAEGIQVENTEQEKKPEKADENALKPEKPETPEHEQPLVNPPEQSHKKPEKPAPPHLKNAEKSDVNVQNVEKPEANLPAASLPPAP